MPIKMDFPDGFTVIISSEVMNNVGAIGIARHNGFTYSPATDAIVNFVNETANDGSAPGAYASILSETPTWGNGTGTDLVTANISHEFFQRM
jgi:hypothetical protein